jgi:lipopolysaccharide export LptBFGC system permease protein LptF
MAWTLHGYIFCRLFKAFLQTLLVLTAVVGLSGGVANVLRGEGFTSGEIVKLLVLWLPMAATFMLAVAALFAATITYGRLAADNEIDACRAAGLNVVHLLGSAFVLSILVVLATFGSLNYVLPGFIQRMDNLLRENIEVMAKARLQQRGQIGFQDFFLHADTVREVSGEQLGSDRPPGRRTYLVLGGIAFVQLKGDDVARFGTARSGWIEFDLSTQTPVVRAEFQDLRFFDRERNSELRLDRQRIGEYTIASPMQTRSKYFGLHQLLQFRADPGRLPEIQTELDQARQELVTLRFYRHLTHSLQQAGGTYRLHSGQTVYTIRADAVEVSVDSERPTLRNVEVIESTPEQQLGAQHQRRYTAAKAVPSVPVAVPGQPLRVELRLEEARVTEAEGDRRPAGAALVDRRIYGQLDPSYQQAVDTEYAFARLVNPKVELNLPPALEDQRMSLARSVNRSYHQLLSIIHYRVAYPLSALVLVGLGAALGIILRGGQVLTAFAISFVPLVFVVLLMIMGRGQAQEPQTYALGVGLIWSGLLLVLLLNGLVIGKWLRR